MRHTKLAYVDTVAKPPRDVRRKQMKYGTATVDMNPTGSKPNPAGYQRSSLKSRLAMDTAPVAPRKGEADCARAFSSSGRVFAPVL